MFPSHTLLYNHFKDSLLVPLHPLWFGPTAHHVLWMDIEKEAVFIRILEKSLFYFVLRPIWRNFAADGERATDRKEP